MACNVFYEAKSEPIKGKFGVAFATINRKNTAGYPSSVCGVIWQAGMYQWTTKAGPILDRGLGELKQWTDSVKVAEFMIALDGTPEYEELDFTQGSTHFNALVSNPWPKLVETAHIGGHRFYVDRRGLRRSKKDYCDLAGRAEIDVCPGWVSSEPVRIYIPGNATEVCTIPVWWKIDSVIPKWDVHVEQVHYVEHRSVTGPL